MPSICTHLFENNEFDSILLKLGQHGVVAEGLVGELQRLAPWAEWNPSHGSIIAKRLHVKGDEQGVEDDEVEHLQYVTTATKCKGKACPSGTSHTPLAVSTQ